MRQKQEMKDTLQPVVDGVTYPQPVFMKTVGWGRHAMKQARKQGLRVVKVSGRCYVRGVDFSAWLGSLGDAQATS